MMEPVIQTGGGLHFTGNVQRNAGETTVGLALNWDPHQVGSWA